MDRSARIKQLDQDLLKLQRDLEVMLQPETPKVEEGLYRRVFGEGITHNVDQYYGISPKVNWAWEHLLRLIPQMGRKPTYMPKTSNEDRQWLERFLKEGES